jgi:hypothetical protein
MVATIAVAATSAVPAAVTGRRPAAGTIATTFVLGQGKWRRGDQCRRNQQSVKSRVRAHGNLLWQDGPRFPE